MNKLDTIKTINVGFYRKSQYDSVKDATEFGGIVNNTYSSFDDFRTAISSASTIANLIEHDSAKYDVVANICIDKDPSISCFLSDAVQNVIKHISNNR